MKVSPFASSAYAPNVEIPAGTELVHAKREGLASTSETPKARRNREFVCNPAHEISGRCNDVMNVTLNSH